jgi:hypothetical protein
MLANSVLVRRSDSADIEIYDQRDNFIASRKSGEWHGKLLFNDFELEEFTLIENDAEIESILTEARAALNRPFVVASDQAAKSA